LPLFSEEKEYRIFFSFLLKNFWISHYRMFGIYPKVLRLDFIPNF